LGSGEVTSTPRGGGLPRAARGRVRWHWAFASAQKGHPGPPPIDKTTLLHPLPIPDLRISGDESLTVGAPRDIKGTASSYCFRCVAGWAQEDDDPNGEGESPAQPTALQTTFCSMPRHPPAPPGLRDSGPHLPGSHTWFARVSCPHLRNFPAKGCPPLSTPLLPAPPVGPRNPPSSFLFSLPPPRRLPGWG
jgi:hypothetical protein